jgi:hypothetical protein
MGIMTQATQHLHHFLRPVLLAAAMLTSAPFFVTLDNTLNGHAKEERLRDVSVVPKAGQMTVIYKT